jgi:hypothetical protein
MRRLANVVRLLTVYLIPVAVAGCHRVTTEPLAGILANGPFFIAGKITEAGHPWGYRVKGEPGTDYRVTDAYFTVGPSTVIQRTDGSAATTADLVVGKTITLWITGAIAESLPPQVGARLIVLK